MTPQTKPASSAPPAGANYAALHNDLQKANQLAAEFQREMEGKSHETTTAKRELQKTQNELVIMQSAIAEMRRKNDRLIQQGTPAERKFLDVVGERDRLRVELEALRQGLAASAEEVVRQRRESDAQIARLNVAIDALKHQLAAALRAPGAPRPAAHSQEPEILSALGKISDTLEQLKAAVSKSSAEGAEKVIGLSFS